MRTQRYHGRRRRFFALLAVAALGAYILRSRPFRVAVEGESMRPTLLPGEYLVAVSPRALRRGLLVVVAHPARPGFELVKRLSGLPGDRIGERVLGPGEFWVTGDHEGRTTDSGHFGPVGPGEIRGVLRLRYWPPSRVRLFR